MYVQNRRLRLNYLKDIKLSINYFKTYIIYLFYSILIN